MTRTAEDVFYEYADLFGWEFPEMADALALYLGELTILDALLSSIQEVGLTEHFEEFLAENWQDEAARPPDDRDLAVDDPAEIDVGQLVRELTEIPLRSEVNGQTPWQREGF